MCVFVCVCVCVCLGGVVWCGVWTEIVVGAHVPSCVSRKGSKGR